MSMNGQKAPHADKAARYLGLLDQALCSSNWSEVPELARKVDKHAPARKLLTAAARAEVHIAQASHRPTSASSATATSIHSLTDEIPRLREAVPSTGQTNQDDALIANSCLAHIYWLQESPQDALNTVDAPAPEQPSTAIGRSTALGWLEVCVVKRTFIRASCLDSLGRQGEARQSYQAAVAQTPGYRSPELRKWTERLLAKACMYSVRKAPSPSVSDLSDTYRAFRAWNEYWQRAPASTGGLEPRFHSDIPTRQVWRAYYDLLSTILQRHLLYSPEQDKQRHSFVESCASVSDGERSQAKRRQRAEMLHVAKTYESLLLKETQFPKASQSTPEVEEWAEQVIANWRIFTGPRWTESDLGEGGKSAVSRNTLNILYNATTKTFHSTALLRQLFAVHAALGEFDLAMRAFDSYVEIVDKGKARAEKTGKHEAGFDNDDTAMLTAVDAIRLLCRHGNGEQAQKANGISDVMQKWLAQQRPSTTDHKEIDEVAEDPARPSSRPTKSILKQSTLAAAYRALGVCQAHWARLTYDSAARASLFIEATGKLRSAQEFDPSSVDTIHALAIVLIETRDISGAIEVLRAALEDSVMLNGEAASHQHHERERRLLSLWHLLALCLTARDQFEPAAQICAAAHAQFGDSRVLFGTTANRSSGETEKEFAELSVGGLVSQMEGFEKESILQIKKTQILLVELMEGPDAAVDLTDGLLGLYANLFGNPEHVAARAAKPPTTGASVTPSRFGGTLRSIAGSIRPRSTRSRRSSIEKDTIGRHSLTSLDGSSTPQPDQSLRPTTNGSTLGPPISITVTNEDGTPAGKHQHRHHLHLPFHGNHHEHGSTLSRSDANGTPDIDEKGISNQKTLTPADKVATANTTRNDQPVDDIAHSKSPDQSPSPVGHNEQQPLQDVRLPASHPAVPLSIPDSHVIPPHERHHQISVLVDVWLFVAGLYIRADSYDDAQNAIKHSAKLVESLESELSSSNTSVTARRLFERGWGGGKSIDELRADVWSSKAELALTHLMPFEALAAYEETLSYSPDHASGTIGLSNLLMDMFEEKLPLEEPLTTVQPLPSSSGSLINEAKPALTRPNTASTEPSRRPSLVGERYSLGQEHGKQEPTPAELNRLAARDRAYMLLSNLTKQGSGYNNSEAWLALARAHELSREIGKAKQALWWVVELEDNKPLRSCREVTPGGFTL